MKKYKIKYNNYQYYEIAALKVFLDKQMAEGYHLCGMVGGLFSLLKFEYAPEKNTKSYAIYHKRLDEQIVAEIGKLKTANTEIICENNEYIVFAFPSVQDQVMQSKEVMEKQNMLLGVPTKKAMAFIGFLCVLSIIGFVLKILLIDNGNLYFNQYKLSLCLALMVMFFLYFIGDLYDIRGGKGISTDGIIHMTDRSKFKHIVFCVGDFLRVGVLLASIFVGFALLNISKNENIAFDMFALCFIYLLSRYFSWLRFRHSYISLLVTEVFLIVVSFV